MIRRPIPLALLFLAWALPTGGCKYVEKLTGKTSNPETQKACIEDLQTARGQKFELEGELEARVSAALEGTVYLRDLAEKLGKEVAEACAAMGRDLGNSKLDVDESLEPGARAKAVCDQVTKLIKKKKEDDGVVLLLYPHAPMCSVGLDEFSGCLRECDSALSASDGSSASCDPESVMGRCEAKCDGTCVQSFSDDCSGTCRGSCQGGCDEGFYGKCGGRCIGTCDGSTSPGKCDGVCDGKCTSEANGSCQGKCKGKCAGACLSEVKRRTCAGTCVGSCSEDFSAQRCGIALPPPEMTPACAALCDAKMTRQLHCIAGHADIMVYHSTKEGAGEKLKAALEKRLDVLIGAEEGMKAFIDRAHEGVSNTFSAIDESLKDDAKAKKKVRPCLEQAEDVRKDAAAAIEVIRETSTSVVLAVKG